MKLTTSPSILKRTLIFFCRRPPGEAKKTPHPAGRAGQDHVARLERAKQDGGLTSLTQHAVLFGEAHGGEVVELQMSFRHDPHRPVVARDRLDDDVRRDARRRVRVGVRFHAREVDVQPLRFVGLLEHGIPAAANEDVAGPHRRVRHRVNGVDDVLHPCVVGDCQPSRVVDPVVRGRRRPEAVAARAAVAYPPLVPLQQLAQNPEYRLAEGVDLAARKRPADDGEAFQPDGGRGLRRLPRDGKVPATAQRDPGVLAEAQTRNSLVAGTSFSLFGSQD